MNTRKIRFAEIHRQLVEEYGEDFMNEKNVLKCDLDFRMLSPGI
jgi:hypothetical protein